ncbi:Putative DNA-binding domain-containing protein [Luteibacter sp. UNC138MFCol5.1]|uniref:HvfC/BufC N-terminal domain-containing protein n=1 Tax=Luteibacter sp. UNC138MFCol5.1 TaxID=1502774 RepID=UPI0008BB2C4B|nr:DNA-binding domain-containing protein [Luteibacter sp. UNC138MFCol5.1]SEO93747.1 Putative DNA-binding domain-containing protein [Luteibacter sp. UNC138MFCol5.1]
MIARLENSWQSRFGDAVLDPSLPVPAGVTAGPRANAARRFGVYRNNAVMGQVITLEDAYPVTTRLVGTEFFRAMAAAYCTGEVPRSPMMAEYGASLPAFVDDFPPAKSLPYLGDVARLERAWVEAYHAEESAILEPFVLMTAIAGDALARFVMHPSVKIVRSSYPVVSIWETNIHLSSARRVDLDEGPESCVIVRPEYDVEVHRLRRGGATFLTALMRGEDLTSAAALAVAEADDFDLVFHLRLLVDARMVIASHAGVRNAETPGD